MYTYVKCKRTRKFKEGAALEFYNLSQLKKRKQCLFEIKTKQGWQHPLVAKLEEIRPLF